MVKGLGLGNGGEGPRVKGLGLGKVVGGEGPRVNV